MKIKVCIQLLYLFEHIVKLNFPMNLAVEEDYASRFDCSDDPHLNFETLQCTLKNVQVDDFGDWYKCGVRYQSGQIQWSPDQRLEVYGNIIFLTTILIMRSYCL